MAGGKGNQQKTGGNGNQQMQLAGANAGGNRLLLLPPAPAQSL
jgi:hypothetical protein